MTVTDQIKILDRRIMQNEAQHDFDRKVFKWWRFSLKPSIIEQTKFKYFPLGKIFKKDLNEDNKKEGLLKRLQNIENKIKNENKKELEPIKNEEQSEVLKDESTVADKKPKKLCC